MTENEGTQSKLEYYRKKYPTLFASGNRGHIDEFYLSEVLPSEALIGNVYVIANVDKKFLYVKDRNGRLHVPGGKKEEGEHHLQTIERELLDPLCRNFSGKMSA